MRKPYLGRAGSAGRACALLAAIASLAFLLVVAAGIAQSTAALIDTTTPLPGFIGGQINADALQLFHGQGLYHNPAQGYIGSVYTPGLAMLVSALDRVHMWTGWVPLVCLLSSVVVAGIVAWLARSREPELARADRWLSLATSLGLAAVAWWLLSGLRNPSLYDGHLDHPAWALTFLALMMVPAAASGSRRALLAAGVLFSLALWTKQIAAVGPLSAVLWLWLPARPPGARRQGLRLAGGMIIANGVLLAGLALATAGWGSRWLLQFGASQPVIFPAWFMVKEFLRDHALALAALVGLATPGLWLVRRRPERVPPSERAAIREHATLLLAFVVIAVPFVFAARRVQGGQDNDYIPLTWGLLLLMGLALRLARRSPGGWAALAALLVALFALTQSSALRVPLRRAGITVPKLHQDVRWPATLPGLSPAVWGYASGQRSFYDWTGTAWSHDGHGRGFPPFVALLGTLASGRHPGYLTDALLARRFAAIIPLPAALNAFDAYASAQGQFEDHFLWKLDQVIAARYQADASAPAGVWVARRGAERFPWMRNCFAPLHLGRLSFSITHGGGFWCQIPGRRAITLRATPAPWSELQADLPAAAKGIFSLSLRSGWAHLALTGSGGGSVVIYLTRPAGSGGLLVTLLRDGRAEMVQRPFSRSSVALGLAEAPDPRGKPVALAAYASRGYRFSLQASAGSGARLALAPPAAGA